ncbi:hypothetical protein SAMD00019534_012020 [Acytostelium subglobosum LB1]|uniref:hypothetical protein n=1 Tax=Acytostelium subglobosum LB1 TaxID=1410327 RepID=UPI000644CF11|nr:hypothetical protein SAMD00019534_012020 [Acytostelium subglobosum LB1]GAM18027.1 hypothetical protein SAMD00019534_012020 [Acytostelium subglobosum LB1]|eukprot:XP_012758623.1 hypothetical protein SAMD00019534_012020 [Acytostelium subglobosum LB1]
MPSLHIPASTSDTSTSTGGSKSLSTTPRTGSPSEPLPHPSGHSSTSTIASSATGSSSTTTTSSTSTSSSSSTTSKLPASSRTSHLSTPKKPVGTSSTSSSSSTTGTPSGLRPAAARPRISDAGSKPNDPTVTIRALQREREELMNKLHDLTNKSAEKDLLIVHLSDSVEKLKLDLKTVTHERDTHKQRAARLESDRLHLEEQESDRLKQRLEDTEGKLDFMTEKYGQLLQRYQGILGSVDNSVHTFKGFMGQTSQDYKEKEKENTMLKKHILDLQAIVVSLGGSCPESTVPLGGGGHKHPNNNGDNHHINNNSNSSGTNNINNNNKHVTLSSTTPTLANGKTTTTDIGSGGRHNNNSVHSLPS